MRHDILYSLTSEEDVSMINRVGVSLFSIIERSNIYEANELRIVFCACENYLPTMRGIIKLCRGNFVLDIE